MPIEFRCHQCGKLLRTADDTAGKQAKCPSCGAIQSIPYASDPGGDSDALSRPPPPVANPFAAAHSPSTGLDADNPYASPMYPPAPHRAAFEDYPRSGPPWERDGASIGSFMATLRLAYGSINGFFSSMRREGGIGWPFGFALAGAVVGFMGFWLLTLTPLLLLSDDVDSPAPLEFLMMSVCGFVLLPFMVVMHTLWWSGLLHLSLMLIGGAREGFETTYRVVAYSVGSVAPLFLIPLCGLHVAAIAQLVFFGVGVTYAHEISGGKGALAVLLPPLTCCCVTGLFYAVVIGFILAAAG
ncbi:MAG: YIP1 family protein [Pirellulales bacterium]